MSSHEVLDTAYTAVFYFSSASDYLRPTEGIYLTKIESSSYARDYYLSSAELPNVLAPLPSAQVVDCSSQSFVCAQRQGALGKLCKLANAANATTTPIIGAQGGFY